MFVVAFSLLGCKSGAQVAGTYHIQQENNAIGEGAEKGELELRDDKSFEIRMLSLKLATGTYKSSDSMVELSASTGKLGTNYRVKDGKLIPVIDGKDVTGWRFVKK